MTVDSTYPLCQPSISSISTTKYSQSLLSPLLVPIFFPLPPVFSSFSCFIGVLCVCVCVFLFFVFFIYFPVSPLLSNSLLFSSCFFPNSYSIFSFLFFLCLLLLFFCSYHLLLQMTSILLHIIVVESHHLMHGVVHIHIHDELPIPYASQNISSIDISIMKSS